MAHDSLQRDDFDVKLLNLYSLSGCLPGDPNFLTASITTICNRFWNPSCEYEWIYQAKETTATFDDCLTHLIRILSNTPKPCGVGEKQLGSGKELEEHARACDHKTFVCSESDMALPIVGVTA
jgi:hypothetical protein